VRREKTEEPVMKLCKSEFYDNTLHNTYDYFSKCHVERKRHPGYSLNEEGLNMTIYSARVEEYGKISSTQPYDLI
jgi:hypothetical protein